MDQPEKSRTRSPVLFLGLAGGVLLIIASVGLLAPLPGLFNAPGLRINQIQIDGLPGATLYLEGPTTIEMGESARYVVRVVVTPGDGESNAKLTTTLKAVLTGSDSLTVVPLADDPEQTASITNGNKWYYRAASEDTGTFTLTAILQGTSATTDEDDKSLIKINSDPVALTVTVADSRNIWVRYGSLVWASVGTVLIAGFLGLLFWLLRLPIQKWWDARGGSKTIQGQSTKKKTKKKKP